MAFEFIPVAVAATAPTYTDLTALNLRDIIYLFAAIAILGAGALSIVFIFFGGFSFILSGGDETKVKQAIHTIRYAIIGLVIALLSLVVVPVIGKLFNFEMNFLDMATLSNRINILFSDFKTTETLVTPVNTLPATNTPAAAPLDQIIR
jgi:hypothetical protein